MTSFGEVVDEIRRDVEHRGWMEFTLAEQNTEVIVELLGHFWLRLDTLEKKLDALLDTPH